MKSAQNIKASTQQFTQIKDIRENIVLLVNGDSCAIVQITAVNFALLSGEEQDSKIAAYASLLNSLSFPIQILIRSKQIEILPYLTLLKNEAEKTQNAKLRQNIELYRTFVESLVKQTAVLDKQFYIVLHYSPLEAGAVNQLASLGKKNADSNELFSQAKINLQSKIDAITSQVARLSLQAKALEETELTKLLYSIFNPGETSPTHPDQRLFVQGGAKK